MELPENLIKSIIVGMVGAVLSILIKKDIEGITVLRSLATILAAILSVHFVSPAMCQYFEFGKFMCDVVDVILAFSAVYIFIALIKILEYLSDNPKWIIDIIKKRFNVKD